jgi:hypothetical protein
MEKSHASPAPKKPNERHCPINGAVSMGQCNTSSELYS